jgi:hypothetical protein
MKRLQSYYSTIQPISTKQTLTEQNEDHFICQWISRSWLKTWAKCDRGKALMGS